MKPELLKEYNELVGRLHKQKDGSSLSRDMFTVLQAVSSHEQRLFQLEEKVAQTVNVGLSPHLVELIAAVNKEVEAITNITTIPAPDEKPPFNIQEFCDAVNSNTCKKCGYLG